MRNSSLAGLTALALTGGSLLSLATPAQAADTTVRYVRQTSTACSDTGAGTLAEPFCSIAPAVAHVSAGQTVDIGAGTYAERVTIAESGTADQPITIVMSGAATLSGPTAGVVVDGQHDIALQNLRVAKTVEVPALDLRNASGMTVNAGSLLMGDAAAVPVVRLTGVTRSTLTKIVAKGTGLSSAVSMDADTTGVVVRSGVLISPTDAGLADQSVGIRIEGPDNTVLNSTVSGFTGAAIAVGPGAADTVVANNQVQGGAGVGIHNRGAARTAITNNNVRGRCLDGIRVDGASSGVSVQNNVLTSNGLFGQSYCDRSAEPGAEIGLYGAAAGSTVVDYNNTYHFASPSESAYSWNGTHLGLAAFRTASGQAAHDRDTPYSTEAEDSANSAAPGFQATDGAGNARADNPRRPDTGAGPIPWADRGATEFLGSPLAWLQTKLDLGTRTVTADASGSTAGYVPITSYVFDFGDGTVVTQDKPVASHVYQTTGSYTVSVTVSGSDNRGNTTSQRVSMLRRTGTIGLLSLVNLRYAATSSVGQVVAADKTIPGADAQFDLADAGNGKVAVLSRAAGRYLVNSGAILPNSQAVTDEETFDLIRNADGTVSLRWSGRGYVGVNASAQLVATATAIGTREKFYRVNVADADRSFKAGANGRYVTAESGGTKPLIANRTSVGPWERFDLVDLGNGQFGLFARANNRFVCADGTGTKPLIANRTSVGAWEKFALLPNADGTVSFKATVNSRYVTADSGGAKPLIANRTAIGPWERFTLGS
ncbi:PKD domain-containing protein [Micromonospora chaiyaphumensis]|uniref:PKD domain-containing protein n=1 Tax=Micromonospora chaiyaphumensis TaxID=307119 RepID=A0A1C4XK90_9ACTN|nr:PKD domain-containing protein [Micromonospora chaiyaphumensis]SCF08867.1 PKD domain-containing protein [Micromonospora chaiyaphumensis]